MQNDKQGKKLGFLLWVLCLIGSWAILPYVHYMGILPLSLPVVLLLGTIQAAVLYGLVCYLSFKLLPKTDLQPFVIKDLKRQIIYPGVIFGLLVGLIIYFLNQTVFQDSLLVAGSVSPPLWTRALASIYGGVNEEVLLRLFLFTSVYFISRKIFKFTNRNRLYFLWGTNIIIALIFGLGHLPAAFKLISPSSFEIFRILLLNGIPGLVFGWLYWSRGLWAAMATHFVVDLTIHVFI